MRRGASDESREKSMKKKITVLTLIALLLGLGFSAQAQQAKKIPVVGLLSGASPSVTQSDTDALRQGLRDLGYIEEKNIVIEYRYAEGRPDRLPGLAAELVRLKVDVIVVSGGTSAKAAKNATQIVPIVMTSVSDPIEIGVVDSLARPGANITGLTTQAPELGGKRLELLKEIVPKLSRVAALGNPDTLS